MCSHALPPIPGTPNASRPGDSPAQVTGSISKEARPGDGDLDLSQWLPPEVCAVYAGKGVPCLYPWQAECLRTGSALQGGNLVYSASTSAGKSLVAEILMVRRLLSGSRLLLLVLPYVALCAEKAELMEALLAPLGKRVGHFYGGQGGGSVPPDANLLVCTIEKANSVVNGMLEEGRVGELGMVVVDELHMVGDSGRGYILELMLTKLKYASGAGGTPPPIAKPAPSPKAPGDTPGGSSLKSEGLSQASGLQIVGMSATMRGGEGVAAWLSASLYTTTFRPVPLHEFIKVGPVLYQLGDGPAGLVERRRVGDEVGELCYEVVRAGHSVLVFCASRVQCETVAKQLATRMPKVDRVHSEEGVEDGVAAVEVLRKRQGGVDATLAQTLPAGVAYHHAGLVVSLPASPLHSLLHCSITELVWAGRGAGGGGGVVSFRSGACADCHLHSGGGGEPPGEESHIPQRQSGEQRDDRHSVPPDGWTSGAGGDGRCGGECAHLPARQGEGDGEAAVL